MNKNSIRDLFYGKSAFLSLAFLELAYLIYAYLVADPISLGLGADGFLNDNLFDLPAIAIVLSTLIVPPIEELITRAPLNKEVNHFGVTFLFLLFISILFYHYSKAISLSFFTILAISLLFGLYKGFHFLKQFVKRNFIYFFVLISFLFAFAHIPVINSSDSVLSFETRLIVVILSILPFSVILGLVRLKYGLRYAILLHIMNNAAILVLNSVIY